MLSRSTLIVLTTVSIAPTIAAQPTPAGGTSQLPVTANSPLSALESDRAASILFDLDVLNPNGITIETIDLTVAPVMGTNGLDRSIDGTLDLYVVSDPTATVVNNFTVGLGGTFLTNPALTWPSSPTATAEVRQDISQGPDSARAFLHDGLTLAPGRHAIAIVWNLARPVWFPVDPSSPATANPDVSMQFGYVLRSTVSGGSIGGLDDVRVPMTLNYVAGSSSFATLEPLGSNCPLDNDPFLAFESFNYEQSKTPDLEGLSILFTPVATGYEIRRLSDQYIPVTGSGILVGLSGGTRRLSLPLQLPLSFTALGTTTSEVLVDLKGGVRLGTSSLLAPYVFNPTANPGALFDGDPVISAGCDYTHENLTTLHHISYDVIDGQAVFTWFDLRERIGLTDRHTTQVVLRPDGSFLLTFEDYSPRWPAVVGVSSGASAHALSFLGRLRQTDFSALTGLGVNTGVETAGIRSFAESRPILGGTFEVGVEGQTLIASGLLIGFSDPMAILPSIGNFACALRSSGEVYAPLSSGSTHATVALPLPSMPTLAGQEIFVQGVDLDTTGTSPLGLIFGNGLRATLGAY
ncbi:MAG: hypothetical protein AAF196_11620 [Planctomycetota bacterium]